VQALALKTFFQTHRIVTPAALSRADDAAQNLRELARRTDQQRTSQKSRAPRPPDHDARDLCSSAHNQAYIHRFGLSAFDEGEPGVYKFGLSRVPMLSHELGALPAGLVVCGEIGDRNVRRVGSLGEALCAALRSSR
jgi:hypothetical protein